MLVYVSISCRCGIKRVCILMFYFGCVFVIVAFLFIFLLEIIFAIIIIIINIFTVFFIYCKTNAINSIIISIITIFSFVAKLISIYVYFTGKDDSRCLNELVLKSSCKCQFVLKLV